MFRFCPACASRGIRFERERVFRCPDCGFTYYHNTAAATGCLIETSAGIVFLVRGKDPAKGKLDLPGGFVDPGEGVFDGLRRELREELSWEPAGAGGDGFTLIASFPNTYLYKAIPYRTCDLFFAASAPELTALDLRREEAEIEGIRILRPETLDFDKLAFPSTRNALKAWLEIRGRAAMPFRALDKGRCSMVSQ